MILSVNQHQADWWTTEKQCETSYSTGGRPRQWILLRYGGTKNLCSQYALTNTRSQEKSKY